MIRVAFYSLETGVFNGAAFEGPVESADPVTPAGMGAWPYEVSPPDPGRWRVEGGELVEYQPPAPDDSVDVAWHWDAAEWRWVAVPTVSAARNEAARRIDAAAGQARARYITTVPGQEATYTAKYAEAIAYRNAGYPDDLSGYPYVAWESDPRAARSARESADRIIQLGQLWGAVIGPKIEGLRMAGKDRLSTLDDAGAIADHVYRVIAELDAV